MNRLADLVGQVGVPVAVLLDRRLLAALAAGQELVGKELDPRALLDAAMASLPCLSRIIASLPLPPPPRPVSWRGGRAPTWRGEIGPRPFESTILCAERQKLNK